MDHPVAHLTGDNCLRIRTCISHFLKPFWVAMDKWITDGTPPPRSVYPTIDAGTLVPWVAERTGWTALPGVKIPDYDPTARTCRLRF
ncbi:MAG: hypothetical protein Ct9H300mP25_02940 [Acidobacteriota bacterium]|nr:MAG: hypothetical protein Ct9H300mP25_02940 [Acidobacteriota bacterium]